MKHSKVNMSSADEAEIVFYEAFMHRDIDVMAGLWMDDCVCVHPGSGVIVGYDSVMRSWKHILENVQSMDIRYRIKNKIITDEIAIHLVTEEIFENNNLVAIVVATNIYKNIENTWFMAEHHGSLVNNEQMGETLQ